MKERRKKVKKYLYILSIPVLFIQPYILITLVLKNITDIARHYNRIHNRKVHQKIIIERIIFFIGLILYYLSTIYPSLLIIANTILAVETTLEIINTTKYLSHTMLAKNNDNITKTDTSTNQTIENQKVQIETKNKEKDFVYENTIPVIQEKKEKVLKLQKKNR